MFVGKENISDWWRARTSGKERDIRTTKAAREELEIPSRRRQSSVHSSATCSRNAVLPRVCCVPIDLAPGGIAAVVEGNTGTVGARAHDGAAAARNRAAGYGVARRAEENQPFLAVDGTDRGGRERATGSEVRVASKPRGELGRDPHIQ